MTLEALLIIFGYVILSISIIMSTSEIIINSKHGIYKISSVWILAAVLLITSIFIR